MKQVNRWFWPGAAALLIGALSFGLSGCGKSTTESTTETPVVTEVPGFEKGHKGVVVELFESDARKADPWHAILKQTDKSDHLRWDNQTDKEVTITFQSTTDVPLLNWPTDGIKVASHAKSVWFTLRPTPSDLPTEGRIHKMKVSPHPPKWDESGPDDPDITEQP
jgi:hypothetical protein